MPREILPLVKAVNQALDRLERGFRTQREFTADAAHELRTPLAILRARIDTLENKTVREALRHDIAGMSRIVSQLLDIAELESFVVDPEEKADLQSVAAEVAAFIAPLAVAQGKSIALGGAKDPVWIKGNPEALFQAIRNLAENAISHTPAGTTVEIEVSGERRAAGRSTTDPACPRASASSSSAASGAATAAAPAVPGSACRSSRASSRRMRDRSRWRTAPAAAPSSRCTSPAPRERATAACPGEGCGGSPQTTRPINGPGACFCARNPR